MVGQRHKVVHSPWNNISKQTYHNTTFILATNDHVKVYHVCYCQLEIFIIICCILTLQTKNKKKSFIHCLVCIFQNRNTNKESYRCWLSITLIKLYCKALHRLRFIMKLKTSWIFDNEKENDYGLNFKLLIYLDGVKGAGMHWVITNILYCSTFISINRQEKIRKHCSGNIFDTIIY